MLLIGLLALSLSIWQITRFYEKQDFERKKLDRGNRIIFLNEINVEFSPLDGESWDQRRVKVTGKWVPNGTIYLDNRSHEAVPGVHVVSALRIEESNNIVWINRGWAPKLPGNIEEIEEFISGKKHLPSEMKKSVTVEGFAFSDLMKRIELSNDSSILINGSLWQNLEWTDLFNFLEQKLNLSFDMIMPFIIWQNSNFENNLVNSIPKTKAGVDKHIGYAVQWFLLFCLSIFFALKLWSKEN